MLRCDYDRNGQFEMGSTFRLLLLTNVCIC